MKKFVCMHIGFEKPTPEIMEAWGQWFESIKDCTVENIGFRGGKEITDAGVTDLGWDTESITGLSIINADSLEDAEKIAASNPFISSIRVYEVMEHKG